VHQGPRVFAHGDQVILYNLVVRGFNGTWGCLLGDLSRRPVVPANAEARARPHRLPWCALCAHFREKYRQELYSPLTR